VEITEYSQLKTKHVFTNLETFGVTLTSFAEAEKMLWPYVVVPDFQVRGLMSNQETGAHTISINPFVYPQDLDKWSRFTAYSQGWEQEARDYDQFVHEELYVLEHYNTSDDHHDEATRWNVTGMTPYVWTTEGKGMDHSQQERTQVDGELFYTPIWQRAPPCDFSSQINMDLRSDPTFTQFIDGMVEKNHPVITKVVDASYLDTNYESRFNPAEQAEPHSYLLEPVYDSLFENRSMVAFLSAFVRWGLFFDDVLPDHEQGLFVVLENTCNQTFTYEILGHKAVYIGEGALHDTNFEEGGRLEETFEFASFAALEGAGEHKFCHYYAHIYPSEAWTSQFFTSKPISYCMAVIACFLITTFFFMLYDRLVQKRQDKVMASAKRTNAIVTSLFPENVRDRLLNETKNPMDNTKADQGKRGSWADPSNAFKNNPGGRTNQVNTSEHIFGSRPIADLFPETTIMFADMVGFTAWSSVRDPSQVFTLLETVYHSFDMIAKRRRVFKGMIGTLLIILICWFAFAHNELTVVCPPSTTSGNYWRLLCCGIRITYATEGACCRHGQIL